jgi:hypothetical protein
VRTIGRLRGTRPGEARGDAGSRIALDDDAGFGDERHSVVAEASIHAAPAVPARRHVVHTAMLCGVLVAEPGIPVQIPAEQAGPVARQVAQPGRHGRDVREGGDTAGGSERVAAAVLQHPVMAGVLPAENARAARTTEWRGDEAERKEHAALDELGVELRHELGTEAVGPLVVGENEHDVRLQRLRRRSDTVHPDPQQGGQRVAQRAGVHPTSDRSPRGGELRTDRRQHDAAARGDLDPAASR